MSDEYEVYERQCEKLRKENEAYLDMFGMRLAEAGLSDKTIGRHRSNMDFYLNVYLLTHDAHPMEEGCNSDKVSDFLGYFFIKKCLWSTPASIKGYAASLKKFYKIMLAEGKVDAATYEDLLDTIKMDLEEWMDECAEYNDFGYGNW